MATHPPNLWDSMPFFQNVRSIVEGEEGGSLTETEARIWWGVTLDATYSNIHKIFASNGNDNNDNSCSDYGLSEEAIHRLANGSRNNTTAATPNTGKQHLNQFRIVFHSMLSSHRWFLSFWPLPIPSRIFCRFEPITASRLANSVETGRSISLGFDSKIKW